MARSEASNILSCSFCVPAQCLNNTHSWDNYVKLQVDALCSIAAENKARGSLERTLCRDSGSICWPKAGLGDVQIILHSERLLRARDWRSYLRDTQQCCFMLNHQQSLNLAGQCRRSSASMSMGTMCYGLEFHNYLHSTYFSLSLTFLTLLQDINLNHISS